MLGQQGGLPQGWACMCLSEGVLPFGLGGRAGARGVGSSRSQSKGCGTVVPKHLTDRAVRTRSTWIFTD